jgi:hypothetical protein
MNSKLRADPMIELFNQSIGRLRLMKTKSLILACLLVGAMVTLLAAPVQASGLSSPDRGRLPAATFSILLKGPYKQVTHAPDLGLTMVDLDDGSFCKTKIFRVSGLPDETKNMAIATATRKNRSAPFTCSSRAVSLPTTSRGARS